MEKLIAKNNSKGVAWAIVLAILAIAIALISILYPVLSVKLEEFRESRDLAHARIAYSDVMIAAASNDDQAEYEGAKIKQSDGTFKAVITPLSQRKDGWTMRITKMTVGDVPSDQWWGAPKGRGKCIIRYKEGIGSAEVFWGNNYGEKWRKYVKDLGDTSGEVEDNKALYKAATENITHMQRREADIDALDYIADYMVGKTPDEIKKMLGESRSKNILRGEKDELFTYYVNKNNYAITLKNPPKDMKFLKSLGYEGKKLNSTTTEDKSEMRTMSRYIFVSNKVIGEPGEEHHVLMKLSFDRNNKYCVKAEVWFEGLKKEGLRAVVG